MRKPSPRRARAVRPYPNLATWRAAHGLNTREAAAVLGMSQSRYSRLERGVATAMGPVAKRVMVTTGVPIEILAGVA